MEQEELKKQVRERKEKLWAERSSWDAHYREISEVLLPRAGRFLTTDTNKGEKRHRAILDSTGTRALRTLAGGMMAGMTSPARPWFRLTTLDPELDESYAVKAWMGDITLRMQMIFNRSNVYRALHTAYEELGAFGTSATVIYDDDERVIHCMPLTVGEYCISTDARGQVDTLYRQFRLPVAAVVREFGYENCSDRVQRMWDEKHYDEWVDIINAIEPNYERDDSKWDNRNMPFRSLYFEDSGDDKFLRQSGFLQFPALCGRWVVTGGDIYGNSPGMEALGDLNQLQQEQLRKAQAIDYQSNPPVIVPGEMKDDESSIAPGGVIFVGSSQQAQTIRTAFDVNLDLSALLADIQDTRSRINEAFYKDIFLMLTTTGTDRMTATEVAERHEEKMLMLGPVLDRLNNEVLDPLITLVFDRMMRMGLIPPPPPEMEGVGLNVDYISILAQSQKAITTNAVDRFVTNLGVIAGVKPEVVDKFDADRWADYYADALGVDPRLVVPGKDVAVIRQQRAEQAAAAQQMEMASQASQVARNLGDMQSAQPQEIAGMFSGY